MLKCRPNHCIQDSLPSVKPRARKSGRGRKQRPAGASNSCTPNKPKAQDNLTDTNHAAVLDDKQTNTVQSIKNCGRKEKDRPIKARCCVVHIKTHKTDRHIHAYRQEQ